MDIFKIEKDFSQRKNASLILISKYESEEIQQSELYLFGHSIDLFWTSPLQDLISMKESAMENLRNRGNKFKIKNTVFLLFSLCEMKFRNIIIELHPKDMNCLINLIKKYSQKILAFLRKLINEERVLDNLKFNDLIFKYYMGSCNKSHFLNWLIEKFEIIYNTFKAKTKAFTPLSGSVENKNLFGTNIQLPDFIQDRAISNKILNTTHMLINHQENGEQKSQPTKMNFPLSRCSDEQLIEIKLRNLNESDQRDTLKSKTGGATMDESRKSVNNFTSFNDLQDEESLISDSPMGKKNVFETDFISPNFKQIFTSFKEIDTLNPKFLNRKREKKISSNYNYSSSFNDIY